jgi:hypothetical protein
MFAVDLLTPKDMVFQYYVDYGGNLKVFSSLFKVNKLFMKLRLAQLDLGLI